MTEWVADDSLILVKAPARRPTQSDIAALAKVHRTTVSLALQNYPYIAKKTREKILRIARKLGYKPDPMLSALVAYRSQKRTPSYQGTLAWLVNKTVPFAWKEVPIFLQYYEGARQRSLVYGYSLEIFEFQNKGVTPERLAHILRSRNIRGILLCPQPHSHTELNFPWDDFSLITFGFSLVKPQLHAVAATQYRSVLQVVRRLRQLGHRRIGCMVSHDDRADHNYMAGYLAEMFYQDNRLPIPPLHSAHYSIPEMKRWFARYRPTALIGAPNLLDKAREANFPVSEIALTCPFLSEKDGPLSGICENSFHIGEIAVDQVVAMIHRGERGIPEVPQRTLVEGEWCEGKTLRPPSEKLARRSRKT